MEKVPNSQRSPQEWEEHSHKNTSVSNAWVAIGVAIGAVVGLMAYVQNWLG
ncbi:tektin family protein [Arcanobacterium phocae]|uniref:tektin family protein n=1 Tax=Arcanobacterium phocae TaxID=131112 RepID=UPI001C0EAF34|nr:tektin family protein [Arcanobacterium phocae]